MNDKALKQIYAEHVGKISDKWSIYLTEYNRVFSEYRYKPLRMLEIGIQNGGSLEIWAKYFPQAQYFVGSDINPDCANLVFDDARIRVVVGDANTDEAQKKIQSITSSFDIILDDGSHCSGDIVKAFTRYFPSLLDGGVFIAEDLHCSYWKEFDGGLFDPYSSLAFFKRLADVINHEHWGVTNQRSSILRGFFSKYDIDLDEESLQHVHSIEFINSMCVIRKEKPLHNVLGPRHVAGKIEAVVPGNKDFSATLSSAPNQSSNEWAICMAPEDEALVRNNQISKLTQQQALLQQQQALLQQQQLLLNTTVMALQQERNSFGFVCGRAINKLLRHLPGGYRADRVVNRVSRFARTIESRGFNVAVKQAWHFLSSRIKSTQFHLQSDQSVDKTSLELELWFNKHEPNREQLISQTVAAKEFRYSPLISAIVPIYKVPREVLDETIKSLESQTYFNWEACIVWADTEDVDGWEWLKVRVAADRRFNVKLLADNGGISRNSNAALEFVEGEFIALLDHDDTLTPWAFFEIVSLLQTRPELDFIYSDKDSISADGGVRMNALFKPEWSPEMLHSVNYLTHLNVIRASLVRDIGGWRPETDGAQDWDLFFRLTERTENIARVASILYHWRILPTSTASGLHAKPYAALAQLKSQQDHFLRRGLVAAVEPTEEGLFKVRWLARPNSIELVIYQTGTKEQLESILTDITATERLTIRRIHVIHCQPNPDVMKLVPESWQERVILAEKKSIDWRVALETALGSSNPQTVVLLDGGATGLSENLVEELGGWVTEHPDIAWATALAVNEDETVYEAGRVVSEDGRSAPLLSGSRLYSFGWLGGPLWYRNASACSPYAVAMTGKDAKRALAQLEKAESQFSTFCQLLTTDGRRGIVNPFARIFFEQAPEKNWVNEGELFHSDPYFSPAFSQVSPLRLHS